MGPFEDSFWCSLKARRLVLLAKFNFEATATTIAFDIHPHLPRNTALPRPN